MTHNLTQLMSCLAASRAVMAGRGVVVAAQGVGICLRNSQHSWMLVESRRSAHSTYGNSLQQNPFNKKKTKFKKPQKMDQVAALEESHLEHSIEPLLSHKSQYQKLAQIVEKLDILFSQMSAGKPEASMAFVNDNYARLTTWIDLDSLLFVLSRPTWRLLTLEQIQHLFAALVSWRAPFRFDTPHYNLILAHTLSPWIDDIMWSQHHHWPKLANIPINTSTYDLDFALKFTRQVLAHMESRKVEPDGMTLSFQIFINKQNPSKVQQVYDLSLRNKHALEPWAVSIVIWALSDSWLRDRTQQNVYGYVSKDVPIITHDPRLINNTHHDLSKLSVPKFSYSAIWAPYSHSLKSTTKEQHVMICTELVAAFTSPNSIHPKSLEKAKRKILQTAKSDTWNRRTVEVLLSAIAETGEYKELITVEAKARRHRLGWSTEMVNGMLKYHAYQMHPNQVLRSFVKYFVPPLSNTTQDLEEVDVDPPPPTAKLEPNHDSFKYLMEGLRHMNEIQQRDGDAARFRTITINNESITDPAAMVKYLIEEPLTNYLHFGNKTVGPGTWDLLVHCYAEVGAPGDALRSFNKLVNELIPSWYSKGLYGFTAKEPLKENHADPAIAVPAHFKDTDLQQNFVPGISLARGVMKALGSLRDAEAVKFFCEKWLFSPASSHAFYRDLWPKKPLVKDETNAVAPVGGDAASFKTPPVEFEPLKQVYEDVATKWLEASLNKTKEEDMKGKATAYEPEVADDNVRVIGELLTELRQRELCVGK